MVFEAVVHKLKHAYARLSGFTFNLGKFSSNILVIFAIVIGRYMNASRNVMLFLLALLVLIIYINGCILIPGFHRLFLIEPRYWTNQSVFQRIQYLFYAYIKSFHKFNTIELLFRYSTQMFRSYPDFYILGPKKCASSALAHHLLSLHIFRGPFTIWNNQLIQNKESYHFRGLLGLDRATVANYRLYWPFFSSRFNAVDNLRHSIHSHQHDSNALASPTNIKYFDADPSHFYLPHIRDRLLECTPNAKFIIMVCNPIQRALSCYYHDLRLRIAFEKKHPFLYRQPSFKNLKEFIDIEYYQSTREVFFELKTLDIDEELPSNLNIVDRHSMIGSGKYERMLLWYLEKFPSSNFLFIDVEQHLSADAIVGTLMEICTFIYSDDSDRDLRNRMYDRHDRKYSHYSQHMRMMSDATIMPGDRFGFYDGDDGDGDGDGYGDGVGDDYKHDHGMMGTPVVDNKEEYVVQNVINKEQIASRINSQLNIGNIRNPNPSGKKNESLMHKLQHEFPVTASKDIVEQLWSFNFS